MSDDVVDLDRDEPSPFAGYVTVIQQVWAGRRPPAGTTVRAWFEESGHPEAGIWDFVLVQEALFELFDRPADDLHRMPKGRRLVELRCERKGHRVGDVWVTSVGPLVLPTVRRGRMPKREAGDTPAPDSFKGRDVWMVTESDWFATARGGSAPGGTRAAILDMTPDQAVGDIQCIDDAPVDDLHCRCGSTRFDRDELLGACRGAQADGRLKIVSTRRPTS